MNTTIHTHISSRLTVLLVSIALSVLVSACGGGETGESGLGTGGGGTPPSSPGSDAQVIAGQALKGPLDDALVEVLDPAGNVLASGPVQAGQFELSVGVPADHPYVEVRTRGGHFVDEATSRRVDVPASEGLNALISRSELSVHRLELVLTPETSVISELARGRLQAGSSFEGAMDEALRLYQQQFVRDSRPPQVASDTDSPMRFGTPLTPDDTADVMAWHRAGAFSHYAQDLGLGPEFVFQLTNALARDMHDGRLDGLANGEPITVSGPTGGVFHMEDADQALRFSQARAGTLHEDVARLVDGAASPDLRRRLELMSLDLTDFDWLRMQRSQGISTTETHLAANDLPALPRLPELVDEDGNPTDRVARYTLRAMMDVDVTIHAPGESWVTPMYRYNALQLPPVIRARRGDEMFVTLVNDLPAASTVHWHGFKLPGSEDGGPADPVAPGSSRLYHFTLDQPAASLWFHPHPHPGTAEQVYQGLAGVLLLTDQVEQQLRRDSRIPAEEHDIPLLIQDRLFDAESAGVRELVYSSEQMAGFGMMGNVVLVNGAELPRLAVETRQYVLRLYNASNSRTYDFALHDGQQFSLVGSDGGWLPSPVEVDNVVLSPGERSAIVIDFAAYRPGDQVMLISRPFMGGAAMGMSRFHASGGTEGMHGGMVGGHHGREPYLPGEGQDIMRFDVDRAVVDDVRLYAGLPEAAVIHDRLSEQDATADRLFVMSWGHGMDGFLINGKQYSPDRIDEQVTPGAIEIWEIVNVSPMPHPFHPHAIQWQVLDRSRESPAGAERGWKDTVLVRPGESVRLIGKFEPVNSGEYVYHCHILEHEDAGMMGIFRVGP